MSKLTNIAAGLAVVPMLAFSAPVFADSPGQLTSGSSNFQVRNVTQNANYSNNVTATCGDELKYYVFLHNAAYGGLHDINVKVDVAAGKVTATPSEGASQGMTSSANVNVSKGSLSLESGSAQLYKVNTKDNSQTLASNLSDSIATSGVNVGDLDGSTSEYIYLKAKVNCPTTPTPPAPNKIQVCELATKKIVTINESDFNSSKYSKDLTMCKVAPTTPATPTTPAQPTTLVNTGAGSVAGIFAAVAAASAVAAQVVLRRRQARADSN